jgi:hypothetical protein
MVGPTEWFGKTWVGTEGVHVGWVVALGIAATRWACCTGRWNNTPISSPLTVSGQVAADGVRHGLAPGAAGPRRAARAHRPPELSPRRRSRRADRSPRRGRAVPGHPGSRRR